MAEPEPQGLPRNPLYPFQVILDLCDIGFGHHIFPDRHDVFLRGDIAYKIPVRHQGCAFRLFLRHIEIALKTFRNTHSINKRQRVSLRRGWPIAYVGPLAERAKGRRMVPSRPRRTPLRRPDRAVAVRVGCVLGGDPIRVSRGRALPPCRGSTGKPLPPVPRLAPPTASGSPKHGRDGY